MARSQWLTDDEIETMFKLAARGLKAGEIAKRIGRGYHVVNRELAGKRCAARRRAQFSGLNSVRLSQVRLSHESESPRSRETNSMTTPEIIRQHFIDELTPAHFRKPRAAADKFFADLTADLVEAGFGEPVLRKAAALLRSRGGGTFPSVAICLAACRAARSELCADSEPTPLPNTNDGPGRSMRDAVGAVPTLAGESGA